MTTLLRGMGLALSLSLVACSGSGGGTGGTSGGGPQPFGTFCPNLLQAVSNYRNRCEGGPAALWLAQANPTSVCAEYQAAITAGRVTYDSNGAPTCLSAVNALPCSTTNITSISPCASTFSGTVATGGTCYGDIDCKTVGNYCEIPPGTCGGTCAAQVDAGDPCTINQECTGGYVCTITSGTTGVCQATPFPAIEGQSCGYNSNSSTFIPCAGPLACDQVNHTCSSIIPKGGNCPGGHGLCENFTYCDPNTALCTAWPVDAGAFCGLPQGQDYINCFGSLWCDTNSTGTGSCAAQLAADAPCTTDGQCPGLQVSPGYCKGAGSDAGGTCAAACTQE